MLGAGDPGSEGSGVAGGDGFQVCVEIVQATGSVLQLQPNLDVSCRQADWCAAEGRIEQQRDPEVLPCLERIRGGAPCFIDAQVDDATVGELDLDGVGEDPIEIVFDLGFHGEESLSVQHDGAVQGACSDP